MKLLNKILPLFLLLNISFADDLDSEFDDNFSNSSEEQIEDDFDSEFDDNSKPIIKKTYSLNFNGSLKIRGYAFIEDSDYKGRNNARAHLDSVLELNSKFKKDNYIVSGSIFSMIGTEHNTYNYGKIFNEPRDLNREIPIAGLRELYLLRSSDNYDIIVGKKIFKTGISTLYSPSDVYNLTLSPDPLDPYNIGVWLGEFEYYTENSNYGIVFFPYISNSKTFSPKSRWSGNENSNQQNINNFVITKPGEIIEDKENKVRVLLKYKTTQVIFDRGVDFLFDVGYGPSLYTILEYTEKKDVYLETRPKVWYVSTGFSTTYKKLEVHAEAYYQNVIASRDDNFISALGGASYTLDKFVDKVGFDKINMTVEYVKEVITKHYRNKKTYKSSKETRAARNDVLIKVDAQINHKWSLNYFANFRLEIEQNKDSGRYQKIGTTYTIRDGLVGELFAEVFNGDSNSYYGRWQDNDRIGLQFKYSF